jgi:hypothetical protein
MCCIMQQQQQGNLQLAASVVQTLLHQLQQQQPGLDKIYQRAEVCSKARVTAGAHTQLQQGLTHSSQQQQQDYAHQLVSNTSRTQHGGTMLPWHACCVLQAALVPGSREAVGCSQAQAPAGGGHLEP